MERSGRSAARSGHGLAWTYVAACRCAEAARAHGSPHNAARRGNCVDVTGAARAEATVPVGVAPPARFCEGADHQPLETREPRRRGHTRPDTAWEQLARRHPHPAAAALTWWAPVARSAQREESARRCGPCQRAPAAACWATRQRPWRWPCPACATSEALRRGAGHASTSACIWLSVYAYVCVCLLQ